MKKFFVALMAVCLAYSANAQIGVIAGLTSTKTDIKSAYLDAENITQYHVGLTYKIPLVAGFAVQPALIYNVKGMRLGDAAKTEIANYEADFKTGFAELPVQVQWGFDLSVARPYIFVEPFLGYAVTNDSKKELKTLADKSFSDEDGDWKTVKNRLEYGFGAGAGVEILNNLQLSVRYFWNMGALYEDNAAVVTDAKGAIDDAITVAKNEKCSGIMASLAIFF